MKALTERIDRWIFGAYTPVVGGLPLFRIFFACYLIFFYLPRNIRVAALPPSFFEPAPGLGLFFHRFPPQWFFWGVEYLAVLGAFCLLFGYRTRLFSLVVAAALIVINSFLYAMGKINHDILVVVSLVCLSFSDWGRHYAFDEMRLGPSPKSRAPSWPLTLLMMTVGLCMITAAYSKAKSGWLDPALECCRGQMLLHYKSMEQPPLLADAMLATNSHLWWKFLDVSTVLIEGAFILAMFWLPAMRCVAALACIFHASIYFALDILFLANPVTYASLIDFRFMLKSRSARMLLRGFTQLARKIRFIPLALGVAVYYAIYTYLHWQTWRESRIEGPIIAILMLVAGICALIHMTLRAMDWLLWRTSFPIRGDGLIVLYDGECGLCDKWVQFVLKHDRAGSVKFSALQSKRGRELSGIREGEIPDMSSIVLWANGKTYRRSDAIAMIFRQLGFPWSWAGGMALLPAGLRNWGYDFVAARRHKWFAPPDACRLPTPEEQKRFLS